MTQRALVVYRIDSPIVKRSILSYHLSRRGEARGRNNRCNVSALYLDSALAPLFFTFLSCSFLLHLFLSLSLFHFFPCPFLVSEGPTARAAAVHLSLRSTLESSCIVRRRSCARAHPFALHPLVTPLSLLHISFSSRHSLSLSKAVSRPISSSPFFLSLFLSWGMMDLRGERRKTENNKVGHAIQARMQRNYTPISLSLEQSHTSV